MSSLFSFRERKIDTLSAPAEDLQSLRERVLNIILILVSILGGINLVISIIPNVQGGNWIVITLYTVAYFSVLFAALNQRIPYRFRAAILVIILLGLSLPGLLDFWVAGDGLIWLLASALLTGALFGLRWMMVNWFIQFIILSAISYGRFSGNLMVSSLDTPSLFPWLIIVLDYILVGFIATVGVNLLVNGLERSIKISRQASAELETHSEKLERRLIQVRTVAEISRTMSREFVSSNYLQRLVEVIQERLNLYFVGVFILDEENNFAVIKAGTGKAGIEMLKNEHKLEVEGPSIISWCIANQEPGIALDVGNEAVRFNYLYLPHTRSELVLPLKTSGVTLGAVTLQSSVSQAFDQDDIKVLQGLADSLATAIENSLLFEKNRTQLEELDILYNASLSMYTSVQSREALLTIAQYMLEISETNNFVISSLSESQEYLLKIFSFRLGEGPMEEVGQRYLIKDYLRTDEVLQTRQIKNLRLDDPSAKMSDIALMEEENMKTVLIVPLVTQDKVLGILELRDEYKFRDFNPQQLRLIQALSAQAAVVLEISNLIERNYRTARNERIISQITSKFQQTINIEEVMTTTIVELSKALGLREATIQLGLEKDFLPTLEPKKLNGTRNPITNQ